VTFLTDLALKRGVASRTQNQALSALLFLYGEVLGKPLGDIHALWAKQPVHERTAPSREQVRALRQAIVDRPSIPARLIVDLLYGCGLRVSEPLESRIKDVLWGENQLVIRAAKGAKDRRGPFLPVVPPRYRRNAKWHGGFGNRIASIFRPSA